MSEVKQIIVSFRVYLLTIYALMTFVKDCVRRDSHFLAGLVWTGDQLVDQHMAQLKVSSIVNIVYIEP